ncbi:MAG TPA: hypothetical protein VF547_12070 [Allosphingosinicella sp.]
MSTALSRRVPDETVASLLARIREGRLAGHPSYVLRMQFRTSAQA